ncbi:hypothetical protein HKX54_19740 [Sulfitobacter sp. M57]|uniref:hypothetical protein n=1 Tax=unclassified Sulfitobacter TaxID=196795 RepID=UPI0023E33988|nr:MULTISPECIES: hypothetical protein [unclassified Sulfitobacter]MDF3416700.1 hypothetical protein [Sulfitobacter sp. KE5]MDF3424181.1 hypothetical protein [Sulfitobacter sp. KE43]MDF3435279.1 hypothetical protein [Sulfitobacter sp. KE42]MDF3460893.1 hypothetical protein [Sulfitobacter sp. S74]MDF3464783.1 hypothetical protein [Sulfitobacter sp. Ks18]
MPASSDKSLPAIIRDPADEVDERHFGVMGNEPRTSLEGTQLDQAVEDMFPRDPAKQRTLPQGQDYTLVSAYENVAYYMPALSSTYVDALERVGLPSRFGFSAEDLQFTNPKSKLCFYPWVLYSGGQAAKTTKLAKQRNWLTGGNHDPRVTLIGDSGGFQIQQGTIAFQGMPTVERMLRWLEAVATHSMVMDFPLATIASGGVDIHVQRLMREGVEMEKLSKALGFDTGFLACLFQTVRNNRYYRKHRKTGATKVLNIIQGRNERESKFWFERMRQFHFDGWTFAGKHHSQLAMTCRRLIEMRDLGHLRQGQWLHFLGVSTLRVGVGLSMLQRALRSYTDAKDIQLSFDSGSPVDVMRNGYEAVTGVDMSPEVWSFRSARTRQEAHDCDQRPLNEIWGKGERTLEFKPTKTALGLHLTLDDFVDKPWVGLTASQTRKLQQVLLIHHNTHAYFEGFRHAYRTLDDRNVLERPKELMCLPTLLDGVFTSETPMQFIQDAERELNALALAKV